MRSTKKETAAPNSYTTWSYLDPNRPNRHGETWADVDKNNVLQTEKRTRGIRIEYNETKLSKSAYDNALKQRQAAEEEREAEKKAEYEAAQAALKRKAAAAAAAAARRRSSRSSANKENNNNNNKYKKKKKKMDKVTTNKKNKNSMNVQQQQQQQQQQKRKKKTERSSNKPFAPKPADKLRSDVIEAAKQLGAKLPEKFSRDIRYRNQVVPAPMANFIELWDENAKFCSEEHKLEDLSFLEFEIQEWDSFSFLKENPDAYLFGDAGDAILVALMSDPNPENFDVYIIDENERDAVCGPIKILDLLKSLKKQEEEENNNNKKKKEKITANQ